MSTCDDTLALLAIEFDDVSITKSSLCTDRGSVIEFDCSLFFIGKGRDLLVLGCDLGCEFCNNDEFRFVGGGGGGGRGRDALLDCDEKAFFGGGGGGLRIFLCC
jgi:hypothetical protein